MAESKSDYSTRRLISFKSTAQKLGEFDSSLINPPSVCYEKPVFSLMCCAKDRWLSLQRLHIAKCRIKLEQMSFKK